MKCLTPAVALLLSGEAGASQLYPRDRNAACFVGSRPSRVVSQSKQKLDASSYFIGKPSPCHHAHGNTSRQDTALSMGIRNMLGLGKKKNDDDDKDETSQNPQNIRLALEAIKADLEAVVINEEEKKAKKNAPKAVPVKPKAEEPVAEVKKPKKKNMPPPVHVETTSATTYGETVRDRINRVKSGQMTDEEKAIFLSNALTRSPHGDKGPTIRQEIPSASGTMSRSRSSSASPFPKDALWNSMIGKGNQAPPSASKPKSYSRSVPLNGKNDSAKREYLDMVTNPDRFKSYAAMGGYRSSSASANKVDPNKGDVVDNLNMIDTPAPAEPPDNALANRLESAAILKEKQDALAKVLKDEQQKTQAARFKEEQLQRAEELRRMEDEKVAAKQAKQQQISMREQEARQAESQRLADMQSAQDDYWSKKLGEENARKDRLLSAGEKERREIQRKQEDRVRYAQETAKQARIEQLREEERLREDPHESEILKEVCSSHSHFHSLLPRN